MDRATRQSKNPFRPVEATNNCRLQEREFKEPKVTTVFQKSDILRFYNKGKTPLQASITLKIPPRLAEAAYRDYISLKGHDSLPRILALGKEHVNFLTNLYDLAETNGLTIQQMHQVISLSKSVTHMQNLHKQLKAECFSVAKELQKLKNDAYALGCHNEELKKNNDDIEKQHNEYKSEMELWLKYIHAFKSMKSSEIKTRALTIMNDLDGLVQMIYYCIIDCMKKDGRLGIAVCSNDVDLFGEMGLDSRSVDKKIYGAGQEILDKVETAVRGLPLWYSNTHSRAI